MVFHKIDTIHFVGIGGIGMSGIAEVLLNLGFKVTGSDLRKTDTTERLEQLGARVFYGHRAENVEDTDVVVVSSAVKADNPEVLKAREQFIPVIQRAEMLAELMRMKYSIAVAGAHGKTTTTSLVSSILGHAGIDPTCVIGGKLKSLGSNAKLGDSKYLVAEADESDGTFLLLYPTIAVVTNIDLEHLDFYKDINEIKAAFLTFLNKVPFYGVNIICIDNANLQSLIPSLKRRYMTYGLSKQADLRAENITYNGFETTFKVIYREYGLGEISITLPGIHNVRNTLAAIGVSIELDIPFDTIKEALKDFSGISRRLEVKWDGDIKLIDDYGHHPTEIRATLSAVRSMRSGPRGGGISAPQVYEDKGPHGRVRHLLQRSRPPHRDGDICGVGREDRGCLGTGAGREDKGKRTQERDVRPHEGRRGRACAAARQAGRCGDHPRGGRRKQN